MSLFIVNSIFPDLPPPPHTSLEKGTEIICHRKSTVADLMELCNMLDV